MLVETSVIFQTFFFQFGCIGNHFNDFLKESWQNHFNDFFKESGENHFNDFLKESEGNHFNDFLKETGENQYNDFLKESEGNHFKFFLKESEGNHFNDFLKESGGNHFNDFFLYLRTWRVLWRASWTMCCVSWSPSSQVAPLLTVFYLLRVTTILVSRTMAKIATPSNTQVWTEVAYVHLYFPLQPR